MKSTRRAFLGGLAVTSALALTADAPRRTWLDGGVVTDTNQEALHLLEDQGYFVASDSVAITTASLRDAVKAFQKANRMEATGDLDPTTFSTLRRSPHRTALRPGPLHWEFDTTIGVLRLVDAAAVLYSVNAAQPSVQTVTDGPRPVLTGLPRGTFWLRTRTVSGLPRPVFLGSLGIQPAPEVPADTAQVAGLVVNTREFDACLASGLFVNAPRLVIAQSA